MDIQLLSASSSPSMNVLLQDATLDNMVYNLKSSLPLMSRQKVSIKANTAWDFNKTNNFTLNRFGILQGLVLKLKITGGTDAEAGANFGSMLVKRAALTSNSREICQLHSVTNMAKTLQLPFGPKQALRDIAHDDDLFDFDASGDFVYVPLHFPFTSNGLGMALDLQFVEEIQCSVELATKDEVASANGDATSAAANMAFDASNSELLCYYLNMSESDLRKYEDSEFSIEKPLSLMASSCYKESSVTHTATGTSQVAISVPFNCPNVCYATRIYVDKPKEAGTQQYSYAGAFQAIDKVEFYMSGRLVWESTGVECQKLENSLFYGNSYGVADESTPETYQQVYTHYWSPAHEKNRFCGGVSGKNVSDFSAKVYITPGATNDEYRVHVEHEYINIVSISGASGKIGVSLSL